MSSAPFDRTPAPPSVTASEPARSATQSNPVPRTSEQPLRPATNPSGLKLSPGTVPPEAAGEDAHSGVQAAIEAGTRAEASLSALHRAVQQISSGVSGARDANERLLGELERVRGMLGASNEQRLALTNQLARLTEEKNQLWRSLEEIRSETARERAFLIEEQDSFIKELLEDHEKALARLASERDAALNRTERPRAAKTTPDFQQLKPPPADPAELESARATIEQLNTERTRQLDLLRRLQVQRDQLQSSLDRVTADRDEARTRLAKLLPSVAMDADDARNRQTEPPPPEPPRPRAAQNAPTARPPSSGSLRAAPPVTRSTPAGGIGGPPSEPRSWQLSPPPEELEEALTPPVGDAALKRKQDPTLRALGRYSLRPSGEMEAPPRTKPPRR